MTLLIAAGIALYIGLVLFMAKFMGFNNLPKQ